MKDLNYGKDYRYAHDGPRGAKDQSHLPKKLEGRIYYRLPDSVAASPGDDEEDFNAPW